MRPRYWFWSRREVPNPIPSLDLEKFNAELERILEEAWMEQEKGGEG